MYISYIGKCALYHWENFKTMRKMFPCHVKKLRSSQMLCTDYRFLQSTVYFCEIFKICTQEEVQLPAEQRFHRRLVCWLSFWRQVTGKIKSGQKQIQQIDRQKQREERCLLPSITCNERRNTTWGRWPLSATP